jgi:catechol 2,3-dioxygenase-like lactoylglutathione lyase family enzyme
MLANHPIDVMILATDLDAAGEFYGDRIGLEVLLDSDDFLTRGRGLPAAERDGVDDGGHVLDLRAESA